MYSQKSALAVPSHLAEHEYEPLHVTNDIVAAYSMKYDVVGKTRQVEIGYRNIVDNIGLIRRLKIL